ncbi:type II secretion system protein [bacterium]|nr:type II secretion system protein [bacterium]
MKKKGFTLAQAPRRSGYSAINISKTTQLLRSAGFTLAEVLITLGIIGVVAAMTIPTLLANINGQRYRSQFKKAISTLSQAARMADAQYGFDYAGIDVHAYERTETEKRSANPETEKSIAALFNGTLTGIQYLGGVDAWVGGYGYIGGPDITVSHDNVYQDQDAYQLSDGTIIGIEFGTGGCTKDSMCEGFIDVNGFTLPNKEVTCSDGKDTVSLNKDNYEDCVVKNDAQHMTDIFPIYFYDSIVIPKTNAAKYVLNTAK